MNSVTHYIRDASGNILATYKETKIEEFHIYGSSRLGTLNLQYDTTTNQLQNDQGKLILGSRNYELTNHLGNVLVVISDKKILLDSLFQADVVSANDYYPFGMIIKSRSFVTEEYRFGYQGSEKDNDLGENNYTTHFRQLDTEIVKWWSIDPKTAQTPSESPYTTMGNNPIQNNDPLGDIISPYYDKDGNFLGTDENGFAGEIFITDKKTFEKYEQNSGKVKSTDIQQDKATSKIKDTDLSIEAQSNIYTHVLLQMDPEDVNFKRLYREKVSIYTKKSIGGKPAGFNNPTRYWRYGASYPDAIHPHKPPKNYRGRIKVTAVIDSHRDDLYTVESIQNYLGVHEYQGHGVNLYGGDDPSRTPNIPVSQRSHWKAYQAQLKHPTFKKLPKYQQQELKKRVYTFRFYKPYPDKK